MERVGKVRVVMRRVGRRKEEEEEERRDGIFVGCGCDWGFWVLVSKRDMNVFGGGEEG